MIDEILDHALRIHAEYRTSIAALIRPLSDDDIETVHNTFAAKNASALDPAAGLVSVAIRTACKREKERRVAAAAAAQEA